ncbi:MAG TPA: mechanosensitive ion channel domain-containing protein, partial [Kofleriaceae bacterium]
VAFALVGVLIITIIVSLVARAAARRQDWAKALVSNARHPFRLLLLVIGLWSAFTANKIFTKTWNDGIAHAFVILTIVFVSWLVGALLTFALGLAMSRYRTDVRDNRVARRVQTQLAIVRRLAIVIVVIIGAASILLTFNEVQALGASLLASAGLVSIVAGLAAQSSLANLFAGLQLAFSDAIRVDDVVVVETQWGKIEEITLTYVVVHIWDDRRMVLPSTYFTTTPFENWTRRSSELLGSIDFDLDWRVSPSEMRTKLDEVLANTALWDKRASVLQVTDAVGGFVHIRVLVTAVDAPTLFDLRCYVREQLVAWLHTKDVNALPITRVQLVEEQVKARPKPPTTDTGGLFTGSPEAEHRAETFTTAIPLPREGTTADAPAGAD